MISKEYDLMVYSFNSPVLYSCIKHDIRVIYDLKEYFPFVPFATLHNFELTRGASVNLQDDLKREFCTPLKVYYDDSKFVQPCGFEQVFENTPLLQVTNSVIQGNSSIELDSFSYVDLEVRALCDKWKREEGKKERKESDQ